MQLPNELKLAIDNNAFCAIATKVNDEEIQNHLMWVDYKDNQILINTEQGRKKTENIRIHKNLSIVIFHPSEIIHRPVLASSHWLQAFSPIQEPLILANPTLNPSMTRLQCSCFQHH